MSTYHYYCKYFLFPRLILLSVLCCMSACNSNKKDIENENQPTSITYTYSDEEIEAAEFELMIAHAHYVANLLKGYEAFISNLDLIIEGIDGTINENEFDRRAEQINNASDKFKEISERAHNAYTRLKEIHPSSNMITTVEKDAKALNLP